MRRLGNTSVRAASGVGVLPYASLHTRMHEFELLYTVPYACSSSHHNYICNTLLAGLTHCEPGVAVLAPQRRLRGAAIGAQQRPLVVAWRARRRTLRIWRRCADLLCSGGVRDGPFPRLQLTHEVHRLYGQHGGLPLA